jgi:type I restriction enzyme, S subunit
MEVKPGYKQTEVGVIPEDWDVVEAFELDPFITSGSRGWAKYYSDRGALFMRMTNLSRESISSSGHRGLGQLLRDNATP